MKKRLISILLLVSMLFTLLPSEAMALIGDNVTKANAVQDKNKLENPFVDVKDDNWYYDAVQYARINGFFSGTGANTFGPNGTMSRGMFVTVLGRMAGVEQNAYAGQNAFVDVEEDSYYASFVAWASKHGITAGVGDDKFDPNGLINREQMALFFIRYFETFGINYDTGINITTIPEDLNTVSPWAKDAVLKLWKTGLLTGDGVNINPKSSASRAQAATLCMRTDKSVKIWYKEPGVPSDRVSIDPWSQQKPETPKTPDSSDDKSHEEGSGGENNSTYYNVTFVIDSKQEEKLYKKDTILSTLPIPAQPTGKVFLGWYYDAEKNKPIYGDSKLAANTTLYAKFADATAMYEGGTLNFVSALDQAADFSITVKADNQPVLGKDFKFRNITAPDKTPEMEVKSEDMLNTETVKVEKSNGNWVISSKNGGFTPGHTYQIELINVDVVYDDSEEVFGNIKENNDKYNIADVRFFNFSIEQDGTLNLKLNDGIKYIDVNTLKNKADAADLMEYAGLYTANTDSQGFTTYTTNNKSGSFTYDGNDIKIGDTVSIYEGTIPTERKPEKGTESKTDNGDVSYVKITKIEDNTYYYVAAEAEDVLFTPDVLPIDVDNGDGTTGWTESGTSVDINNEKLIFSNGYEEVGLSDETTVDVGDYLAFYTGTFGQANAVDKSYGEIIEIDINGDETTINYKEVNKNQVMSAMDLYDETQLSEGELQSAIDENKDKIQEIIEAQLMESDFFDEAGEYLAELSLKTDEVRDIFGDGVTISDCLITYANNAPLGAGSLAPRGNIVDKDAQGKKPKVEVSISPKLAHFSQSLQGLRMEVAVTYNFEIQKKGNNNKMEVELTAFFEQEVTIGFSVSGGAVWKKAWIFPYISDYRMNGNLDLGTYTGIGITATAKLTQDEEAWGMPWPNSVKEAATTKKIFNLSESIKKEMKEIEEVLPEATATASGGLAEKYANFMEDANEEWVDLITVNLIKLHGAVDPLHILAYGLQVDFVVSANLNVAIGMTFQYENFKRHSFSLSVKSKKADSNTVDLSTNGYQFDFYVMGTIGLRAGIRAKATVGLFSTKLAGIGLQIEAGAYTRMWGYFYYHLENWKVKETSQWKKDSGYSGAVLIEIGAYLDVKFIAEALNGKYSYAPTIYAKEWPFWSAGQRENVYDFVYENNPDFDILNVNTYTLPSSVYDMHWMDLKTGELEKGGKTNIKNFDNSTATSGHDEACFAVELSNPSFTYNPVNNLITVNTGSGELSQSCEMKITWKGAPMSGSSDTLSRTFTLNWSNETNAATIEFETSGGSAVKMLRMVAGASIINKMPTDPTKLGYTFDGWYTDNSFNTKFVATTMPVGNTKLYAKWIPNTIGYTVEHYQKSLDGQYVLIATDNSMVGNVGSLTEAAAKSYEGFTAQNIKQQEIAPDGSTIVMIYYDRNTYNLKYIYGNGNDVIISVPYGYFIVKPSNPEKQGYNFTGWDNAIPDNMPAQALTFTAHWTEKTDTPYTVKHIKQSLDGSYYATDNLVEKEVKYGTTGQNTSAAAKNYIGFTSQEINQKNIKPDGSTVVEVKYTRNEYFVIFNKNNGDDGIMEDQSFQYGEKKNLSINDFTKIGHNFVGWNTNSDGSGTSYNDEAEVENLTDLANGTVTLYAQWNIRSCVVTFDSNKGNGSSTPTTADGIQVTYDQKYVTLPSVIRDGYVFNGWYTSASGGTAVTVEDIVKTDHTLYAQWTANAYTVTFNGNGNDGGSMEDQSFTYDVSQALTANTFTKIGHTFVGWNTMVDGSGTSYTDNALVNNLSSTVNGTLNLYAQWTGQTYTVTFNSNKGSGSSTPTTAADIQVTYGKNYGTLPTVTRDGYTFKGWYTAASDGDLVTDAIKMENSSNHTLYAQWTVNAYTVTFNGNNNYGGSMEDQSFIYDVSQALTTNTFTKTGYMFVGWNTKPNGSGISYKDKEEVKNLTEKANEKVTLYAQWEAEINDAQIGSKKYAKIQTAFSSVEEGETIQLLQNVNSSTINVNTDKDVNFTLDLNGYTIDFGSSRGIMYYDTGIFTIADSVGGGKITGSSAYDTIELNGGRIVFAGGTVENTNTDTNQMSKTINVTYSGAVTVTGSAIKNTGAGFAIYHDGTGTVDVSGGSVSANTGVAIFQENIGKITIGGTALVTSAKEYKTEGYITEYSGTIKLNGSGTSDSDTLLEITGGTIENTAADGLAIFKNTSSKGKILISGGPTVIRGNQLGMNVIPELGNDVKAKAQGSVNFNGSPLIVYEPIYNANYGYKYIIIK